MNVLKPKAPVEHSESTASAIAGHHAEARAKGVALEFNDLAFTVKNRATGEDKEILTGIYGKCMPGRLFALMGGSGAGKTTLLDVLACQAQAGGRLQGEVLVNGQPRNARQFARVTCYVSQRDMLMASATVRECVMTSALLRLPRTMPRQAKINAVDDVLKELELDSCANVLVGDEAEGIKGISGGQKRRVSLAIEMVKDPVVIFADEPTSGLDSEVALSIIDALLMLARKRRTVVCTIHQPNSDITDMFDDFMLLATGRCVYHGPWKSAVDWFATCGFRTPTYKNPTDYFMSVIKDDETAFKIADMFEVERAKQEEQGALASSADHDAANGGGDGGAERRASVGHVALSLGRNSSGASSTGKSKLGSVGAIEASSAGGFFTVFKTTASASGAPLWYQVTILMQRTTRNWLRNPNMLMAELVQYIVISLFVGLMYVRFGNDEDGVYDRAACIWFVLAIMSFTPSYTGLVSWGRDRPLMRKELMQRQYSITALYVSRTLVLLPVEAVQCLVFVCIMYFFCGFQAHPGKFFIFYAVLSIFQFIAEGMGLLSGILTKQVTYGIVILTFLLLLLLSFSGFLTTSIPVYFIWVNKISFLTYAYNALLKSELSGLTVCDSNGDLVDAITFIPSVIDNGLSIGANVGILIALWGGMEFFKWLAMHLAHILNVY